MKRGTHWKPQPKRVPEASEPLRPVKTRYTLVAELQAKQALLEEELRDLFDRRRKLEAGLPISQKSRQLRAVKQQLRALIKVQSCD